MRKIAWKAWEISFLAIALIAALVFGVAFRDWWVYIANALVGIVYIVLLSKNMRSAYIWGFVGAVLNAWIMWVNGLYSGFIYDIYFAGMLTYAFIHSFKNVSEGEMVVHRLKPRTWLYIALIAAQIGRAHV